MKFLIMQSSPLSRYFFPLRSTYSPQYPVLKYPEPFSFLTQRERESMRISGDKTHVLTFKAK